MRKRSSEAFAFSNLRFNTVVVMYFKFIHVHPGENAKNHSTSPIELQRKFPV